MNSAFFNLWFDHYKSTITPGSYRKTTIGITDDEFHVKTREGEFYLTMDAIIDYVMENGECVQE